VNDDHLDLTKTAAIGNPATAEGRAALVEIFRLYFDNVNQACAAMRGPLTSDDLRVQAHRAKGASGVVGARVLAGAFADLEARAAAGETPGSDVYDELEQQLADLRRTVSAALGVEFP
jgi:HPt (histidine-containing phosphotransfer) domain-containing protein